MQDTDSAADIDNLEGILDEQRWGRVSIRADRIMSRVLRAVGGVYQHGLPRHLTIERERLASVLQEVRLASRVQVQSLIVGTETTPVRVVAHLTGANVEDRVVDGD